MQNNSIHNQLSFFQKLRNFDHILLTCIFLLGVISVLSMYSTDSGQFLFYTKSHIIKIFDFFPNDDYFIFDKY